MPEIKTKSTPPSVEEYIANIPNETRRGEIKRITDLVQTITNETPVIWGQGIIGFGSYHYKYATGREGDMVKIGVASRTEHIVFYGLVFYDKGSNMIDLLGKYKRGKGCLYIKRLSDIRMDILEQMIREAYAQPAPNEEVVHA